MGTEPSDPTWLHDVNGNRIGIQVVSGDFGKLVKTLLPDHGLIGTLDASEAAQVVQKLRDGITFSEITGSSSFQLNPSESSGSESITPAQRVTIPNRWGDNRKNYH